MLSIQDFIQEELKGKTCSSIGDCWPLFVHRCLLARTCSPQLDLGKGLWPIVTIKNKESVAPAFGQWGGGVQYYSPFLSADDLLQGGYLQLIR